MSEKNTVNTSRFLGLLECPLRAGFIEFEYTSGDTIADLKVQALENWGDTFPDRRTFEGGFFALNRTTKAWSILVEDQDGAYLPLKDDDKIPLAPPPSTSFKLRDPVQQYQRRFQPRTQKRIYRAEDEDDPYGWKPIPPGVIYEVEHTLDRALWHLSGNDTVEKNSKASLEKGVSPKDFRLLLRITREGYRVPRKRYSVRLVALATLTGG